MPHRSLLPSLAFAFSLVGLARAQEAIDLNQVRARVEALATRAIETGPLAGLSIGIRFRDETVVAKGFGFADLEHEVPASAQTVYRIASMTKQFTAAAVMQLVEEGKLSLDDSVEKLAPDFPLGGKPVTLRNLLNHTSGIPSYTSLPGFAEVVRGLRQQEDILNLVKGKPFDFDPGDELLYNNTGYFLAGFIAARADGKPYDELIQTRIFEPLAMTSSRYGWEAPIVKHRAQGYTLDHGKLVNDDAIDMAVPGGAGALLSTVGDMLLWVDALQKVEVVGDESLAAMTTPTLLNDGTTVDYGFGLALGASGGHPSVGHGGNITGFNSHVEWYPEDALSIVVLVNTEGNSADDLTQKIARLFLPAAKEAPKAAPKEEPLAAADLARCAGSFKRGARPLVLAVEGDHLTAKLGNQSNVKLLFQRRTTHDGNEAFEFLIEVDPTQKIVVHPDPAAAASARAGPQSAMLVSGGSAIRFTRG